MFTEVSEAYGGFVRCKALNRKPRAEQSNAHLPPTNAVLLNPVAEPCPFASKVSTCKHSGSALSTKKKAMASAPRAAPTAVVQSHTDVVFGPSTLLRQSPTAKSLQDLQSQRTLSCDGGRMHLSGVYEAGHPKGHQKDSR